MEQKRICEQRFGTEQTFEKAARNWKDEVAALKAYKIFLVFTALHVMQTRYSDENSVCPFVRPSRKICPDFYTIRKII